MTKRTITSSFKAVFKAIWNILSGKIVTVGFIKRQFAKVAVLLFVIFGFIANRFSGMLEMRRIDNLENELKTSQSSYIISSADYFSKIREKTMKQLVDTMKLGLSAPEQPPYMLTDDE